MRSNRTRRGLIAIGVALAVLALQPVAQASAGRYRERTRRIAPGVRFTRISDSRGPNQLRLLTIDPSSSAGVEVAMGRLSHFGRARTTRIAARGGAIAAVNGDFFERSGQMFHTFIEEANLRQSQLQRGWTFTMSATEEPAIFRPSLEIEATPQVLGEPWRIDRWNVGRPVWGEVVAYTPVARGVANPPREGCTARLLPAGEPVWTEGSEALARDFTIDAVRCSKDPLAYADGIVLGSRANGPGADRLRSLIPATTLRVAWSLGTPGVVEAMGGMPLLVQGGTNVAPRQCWTRGFCARNPRTGVGVTADGRVLLLTVDGRQPGWSVGMTMVAFAEQFVRLGAMWALNLDGGGSTTMVVGGDVKNRPSGGRQRRVGSAILVTR